MKIKLIGLVSFAVIVLLIIVTYYYSYIFTDEHRVILYLRNYAINLNLPARTWVTVNYSNLFTVNATGIRAEKDAAMLNHHILPSERYDDILLIYNRINNSNYKNLPDIGTIFKDYTIYSTHLVNFHGVDLFEGVYSLQGEFLGSPTAVKEVISFFSQTNKREPRLVYILFRRLHSDTFDILPIDIDREEFILYYDSLVSDFLKHRADFR